MQYLLFSIVLLIFGCASSSKVERMPKDLVSDLGLKADIGDSYKVEGQKNTSVAGVRIQSLSLASGKRAIRIERLAGAEEVQAESFIKDKVTQFESIYDPHPDPYFASITKATNCPSKFLLNKEVVEREGVKVHQLSLFANDRLTYGSCTEDQAQMRARVTLMRCPKNGDVFLVETFVPVAEYTDTDTKAFESIQCQ